MKKIIFITLVLFLTILNFQYAEAKKKTYQNGNFRYTYKMEKRAFGLQILSHSLTKVLVH